MVQERHRTDPLKANVDFAFVKCSDSFLQHMTWKSVEDFGTLSSSEVATPMIGLDVY